MRLGHRLSLLALAALCAVLPALAAPSGLETRLLLDGQSVGAWQAVESTLTPAAVQGESALLFRVPVDWHGGEPNYPIGWPRIQRALPAADRDWRGWDQLRLRVLGRSSAGRFPFRPFGPTISSGDRGGWERDVPELKADTWQDITLDLRDLPSPERVESQGLYISEDKYPDGTVLEFYLSRLELVRYTDPTLVEFAPVAAVASADEKSLPVRVKLDGLPRGQRPSVGLALLQGRKVLASTSTGAPAGETRLSLPLARSLPP